VSRFPFNPAFVLAPMEGVTTASMRELIVSYGPVGLVCTEFVRVAGEKLTARHLERQVRKCAGAALSVQLMGNEPELMAQAAALVARAGADVVDVNFGCPSALALRKGVGAALLRDPARMRAILVAMRRAVPGLLSVKLRAGFECKEEALSHARLVEEAGVDFIVIHPRRRSDLYRGVADWRIIALLRRELTIPVVGNGDVWYAQDALRLLEETQCDAVMLGRPALRNPWIFRQIDDLLHGRPPFAPSGIDLASHLRRVHHGLLESWRGPPESALGALKEQLVFIGRGVPGKDALRRGLLQLGSTEELLEAAEAALAPLAPEGLDLDAYGRHGLERSGSALGHSAEHPWYTRGDPGEGVCKRE
jgi:tRNA-dihydrouridine synthase B